MSERQGAGDPRLTPGLCSVTFRALPPADVLRVAVAAGSASIEWGGDVHVPDVGAATRVRGLTADAGIEIASYGSYFAPGDDDDRTLAPVLATATALGARTVRVWAGRRGSTEATRDERAAVVSALCATAVAAGERDLSIALEFHRRTLTDTTASTLRLLDEVGAPNLTTYWQPPVGGTDEEALAGLTAVLDHVSHVHVFSWDADARRLPLRARASLWEQVIALLSGTGRGHHLHLEFVAGDAEDRFADDAAFLRSLLPR